MSRINVIRYLDHVFHCFPYISMNFHIPNRIRIKNASPKGHPASGCGSQQGFFMFVLVEFQGISNLLEVSTHPAIFCMFWSTSLHHLTGPYQSIALLFSCLHHAHSWNMTKCSRQGCPCSSWWGIGLSASVSPWHKEISGCEAWSPTVTGKHLACKPIQSPQNRVAIQSVCSRSM